MREWSEVIERDYSHPCIIVWVPFNESWGVPNLPDNPSERHYVQALYHLTRTLDSTRPVKFQLEPPWLTRLQAIGFDAYQRAAPRSVEALPAVIVAIDDRSIAAFGQWPWPRTTLARLIGTIAQSDPAAIGIDILMPEPDRLSAERLLDQIRQLDIEITVKLSKLRNNDEELAEVIARTPSVLPLAGTSDISGGVLRAPPILVRDMEPKSASDRRIHVPEFKGVVSSLDELDRAASGRGLVSVLPNDGIARTGVVGRIVARRAARRRDSIANARGQRR